MAVTKEIWEAFIASNLFTMNPWINYAKNRDGNVLAGKVVHIPQAGAKPTVERNGIFEEMAVTQRADDDITYAIDTYRTRPTGIDQAEQIEVSYDKINDVLGDHMEALQEEFARWIAYDWSASAASVANIIRTTGGATQAHADSATGNRKKFVKEDLKKARFLLNKQNIPKAGRKALIDSDMMDQLLDDQDLKNRDSSMELDMKNGIVTRLYGFDLIERSETVIYDNTGTPIAKSPAAAAAATDNASVFCWHPKFVHRAVGAIKFFENGDDAQFQADVYSAQVRIGASKEREDERGIVQIVQEAAA